MDSKNKKNNEKETESLEDNINTITNIALPYETARILDKNFNAISNSLFPIMNMTNTINTLPDTIVPIMNMENNLNNALKSLIPLMENTNKHFRIIEDVGIIYQSVHPFETFIKTLQPIDLLERFSLLPNTLEQIHNSFNLIDWNSLNITLNAILETISTFQFNFILTDKEIHANLLYHYVSEIDNEEISSIFTYDFLLKIITDDWWIIPTLDIEYYKKMSEEMNDNLNQSFLNEFYNNPNLIKEMTENWDITSNMRKTIINQALMNYMIGNYEICVIALILQIEGIMKEKISHKKSSGTLRASLEKKLINTKNDDPWNTFLNKANIEYIWNILNPLDKNVDFKEEMGIVNRNGIAHTGVVEADQLIAMRLFFIIDTLMYIFKTV